MDWGSLLLNVFGAGSAAATGDVSGVALTGCLGFSIHKKMEALVAAPFVAALLWKRVACPRKAGSARGVRGG